jgi:DNA-directed RNA polymerase specialized sigma24 family protein
MIEKVLGIIKNRANQFHRTGVVGMEFEDLVSEGYLWLLENGSKFDSSKNIKYSTWVYVSLTNLFTNFANKAWYRYTEELSDVIMSGFIEKPFILDLGGLSEGAVFIIEKVLDEEVPSFRKNDIREWLYSLGWKVREVNAAFAEIKQFVNSL